MGNKFRLVSLQRLNESCILAAPRSNTRSLGLRPFQTSSREKQDVSNTIPLATSATDFGQANKSHAQDPPLSRLSTWHIVRNIALGSVFTRPWLFRMSMAFLGRIADPKSKLLYPEKNPIVHSLIRSTIYAHFCAGTNAAEVNHTVTEVRKMGYAGVIICPSREIMADTDTETREHDLSTDASLIEEWKQTHLETLRLIGKGDYMGMKYTGAGQSIFDALEHGLEQPPQALQKAIDEICTQAAKQGSRVWIDAEQQVIQPTIDRWTVGLMRKYNNNGEPIVSNTYQAYLKSCPSTLEKHLRLAQSENWTLGIKLVRGAYIASEVRERIHDTKPETDAAYDSIAAQVIRRSFPGFDKSENSPDAHIFLAGHNANSISKAAAIYAEALSSGKRCSPTRWGQLQGMADEVSCWLLQQSERMNGKGNYENRQQRPALEVYKCLQWGTVGECMQYLLRRATENSGAAQRAAESLGQMKRELWRRLFRRTA